MDSMDVSEIILKIYVVSIIFPLAREEIILGMVLVETIKSKIYH